MKTTIASRNYIHRLPGRSALILVLLLIVCFGFSPMAGGGWNVVPSPNTGSPNNYLFGVAAIASNDVWAVGAYGVLGISAQQLIEHWDGSSWRRVVSPSLATPNELLAVSAIAANDVWAVGGYNSGGQALVQHWNGTSWNVVPNPNPGTFNRFFGVAAISSQNVWTVGQFGNGGLNQTLVEHWDGTSWSAVPSPNVPNQHNKLNAVTGVPGSPNELWAVGTAGTSALILHWNGTQWSIVPSSQVGINPTLTSVVAISTNDVWAVGYTFSDSRQVTLTEHWNGSTWSVVPSPNPSATYNYLLGVTALATNNVWAVGNFNATGGNQQTLILKWNGTAWVQVAGDNSGPIGAQFTLSAVSAISGSDIWAVGDNSHTLAEYWNATRWSIVSSPNAGTGDNFLNGVSGSASNDVWEVGYYTFGTWGSGRASGRNSDFFDAVEGLLNEARGLRDRVNLHVIVVCREFDWQNDHRLRRLLSDQHTKIEVGEFSPDEVKRVLEDENFRPALFQHGQLELLRLPQNLSLFLEAGFDPAKRPEFNTAKELFDRYWDEKSRAVARRAAPAPDQWGQVIEVLTEEMTRTQQLSVPRGKLDRFSVDYLQQMASEGVLTFDGERYGFGHESFFDYCFARRFVASERSLCDFLASAEQHLFHRAQVRQVLAYLRDANKPRYISELHGLLHDSRIRAHIKDLALAFLTSVPDPSDDEWKLLEPWLNAELAAITAGQPNSDRFATLAWNRFFVSQSWFDAADRRGLVVEWMASAALANTATDYLRIHQRHAGDRIADLLEPYVTANQEWPCRIQHIMQWAELENSRKFFELFLRLIDNGTLDNARGPIAVNSTFWSMLYGLAQARPAWIAEVIAHWLRRRRQLLVIAAGEQGKVNWHELFGHDQFGARHFHESASAAPETFVEHVLPVVLEISDAAIYQGDHSPPGRDAVWLLFFPSHYEDSDHACLTSLISALQAAAKSAPDRLKGAISELRKRNSYVSNALLLNIYAAAPPVFAEEAASTLVAEPWRFHCGFSDSPYWTAMQLITQICPLLSPETREQLEAVILDYSGDYEHTPEGYKLRGRSSFALLSAIPPAFRSKTAASRYQELERKFQSPYEAPTGIRGGTVTSPIERSAAEKMSDEQWLKAMKKYDSEYSHPPGEFLKGGAWELAGMFRDFVTNEPERFARLCLKLPPDINPAYLGRALDALKEASVPTELKFELCRKAFAEHPDECAREIADLLASIKQSLPNDLVNMLTRFATEHPDPDKELWNEKASGGTAYYGGDILTHGINTTRGRAADAIRDLIFSDKTYVVRFATALPKLVQDRSLSVRACVASTLIAVAQTDWSLAIRLFKNLVQPQEKWLNRLINLRQRIPCTFGIRRVARWVDKLLSKHLMDDDRLLGTQYVDRFIYYGVRDHFSELRPVVERMLRSQHPHVREAGARLSSLAALLHSEPALVKEALNGDAPQRLGVAKVASSNIASRPSRCWCTAQLIKLFNDQDADVCREAASCFRTLKDEPFEEYGDLIDAFADSKAYQSDSSSILFALEESPEKLPGVTATICEKFLSRFADEARDVRTSRSADVHMVSKLVFRTYHQHETDEWGSKCLDLIDQMCLAGIHEVSRGLADFER